MIRPVLYRKLKQMTYLSVIELINVLRLKKAARLLAQGQLPVSEVAYQVGFSDPKYFGKSFKSYFGKSPTAYTALDAARSEEHTSELQSLMRISYAVFCLKNKNNQHNQKSTVYN